MSERTHDEFCFNTDLYQDDVEDYMCICNRLDSARHQERADQQELTKAEVQQVTQLWQQKAQAMEERGVARGIRMAHDAVATYADSTTAWDFDPGRALAAINDLTPAATTDINPDFPTTSEGWDLP